MGSLSTNSCFLLLLAFKNAARVVANSSEGRKRSEAATSFWRLTVISHENSCQTPQRRSTGYWRPGRTAILPTPKVVSYLTPPYHPNICRYHSHFWSINPYLVIFCTFSNAQYLVTVTTRLVYVMLQLISCISTGAVKEFACNLLPSILESLYWSWCCCFL